MLKKDSTSNNGYIDESKQKESKRNEKKREEVEGAKKRINRFLGGGKGMSSMVGGFGGIFRCFYGCLRVFSRRCWRV